MKDKHDYTLISEAYASIYKENIEDVDYSRLEDPEYSADLEPVMIKWELGTRGDGATVHKAELIPNFYWGSPDGPIIPLDSMRMFFSHVGDIGGKEGSFEYWPKLNYGQVDTKEGNFIGFVAPGSKLYKLAYEYANDSTAFKGSNSSYPERSKNLLEAELLKIVSGEYSDQSRIIDISHRTNNFNKKGWRKPTPDYPHFRRKY